MERSFIICPLEEFASGDGGIRSLAHIFCNVFKRHDFETAYDTLLRERTAGQMFLVATLAGVIVGFVSWRVWGEPRHRLAEIYHVGVVSARVAAGTGRQLVAAAEEAAHEYFRSAGYTGARKVFLLTHATNTPAQNLYRRCGYQHVATLPEFFREGVDEFVMEKTFPERSIDTTP